MIPYFVLGIFISVIGFLSEYSKKENFLTIIFILILLFSGLRGDFTIDYKNYQNIFYYVQSNTLDVVLNTQGSQEIGFILFTKLFTIIGSVKLYMFTISSITMFLICNFFKKKSQIPWISIVLFVGLGSYYTSFNVSRAILAVSVITIAYDYLEKGCFFKYILIVLLASFFHTTALIMIPFYFILRIKFSKRYLFILILISIFILLRIDLFINLAYSILPKYSVYSNNSYGMQGGSIGNAIIPLFSLILIYFGIFVLGGFKRMDLFNVENNILFNCCYFYLFFGLASLKVYMLIRFTYYFELYVWIFIAKLISQMSKTNKLIVELLIIIICLIVPIYLLKGTAYNPFYFIWR